MRESWIDRWRGILMLCIVAFHVMGAMVPCCDGDANNTLTFFIDRLGMFHTKGFFVISGMLWRPGISFGWFLKRRAGRLLVPYFIFGFAWALLYVVLCNYFQSLAVTDVQSNDLTFWQPFVSVLLADGWPNGMGFRVINALWFLPCLFWVEIFYYWIDRFIPIKYCQLALLPVCFAIDGWIAKPDIFWSLNLVPRFLLFFIVGRVFLGKDVFLRMKFITKVVTSTLLIVAIYHVPIVKNLAFYIGVQPWSDIIRGICGIIACALISQMIPSDIMVTLGKSTIGILVTHKAFILALQLFNVRFSSCYIALASSVIVSAVVCALSLIATCFLRKWCKWALGELT